MSSLQTQRMGVRRVAAAQAFDSKKIEYCGGCCGGETGARSARAGLSFRGYLLKLLMVKTRALSLQLPSAPCHHACEASVDGSKRPLGALMVRAAAGEVA